MIRPKASSLYLTLCLLFVGVLTATASDDVGILRARMDSLRRVIPTKTGADRQSAWTRLYYNAFHIDSDTLALQVLNEWIADAHIHGDIATGAVQLSGITQTTAPAEPASAVTFQLLSHLKHEVLLTTNQTYATRALRHLIENARKFTRQGTVTLVLTATDKMAVFTVEDTGIGLSLARNIARKLGGDIVLDVQYTPGARFIMTLPFS